MGDWALKPYFRAHELSLKPLRNRVLVGRDSLEHYVYQRAATDIVRFSDANPKHNPEGFFYNLLLEKVPFRDEAELVSAANHDGSYFTECILRKLVESNEAHLDLVEEYCERHLYREDQLGEVLAQLGSVFDDTIATMNRGDASQHRQCSINGSALEDMRLPTGQQLIAEANLSIGQLFPDQQRAFAQITDKKFGLVLLTGGPGSGKTKITRDMASHFRSVDNRKVLLSASTGAAAMRLSQFASTCHSTFGIPVNGHMKYFGPAHHMRAVLTQASVYFIDEVSMISTKQLQCILMQLMRMHKCESLDELLGKVLIILVGDHCQLPPVCNCHRQTCAKMTSAEKEEYAMRNICRNCHLAYSAYWDMMTICELTSHPRFDGDREWAEFLDIIRTKQPTTEQLQRYLGNHMNVLNKLKAMGLVGADVLAICSHREDVAQYNEAALCNTFAAADIVDVQVNTNAAEDPRYQPWVEEPNFHLLTKVAVGARVALTSNEDLSRGAANGSTGVVTKLEYGEAHVPRSCRNDVPAAILLLAIHVKLDVSEKTVRITRTHFKREHWDGQMYYKSTFPLMLAYAMTGHRSQGATIEGHVIVDIRQVFSPGLLYVILSRVRRRDQLQIVGTLEPDMFCPIQIERRNGP